MVLKESRSIFLSSTIGLSEVQARVIKHQPTISAGITFRIRHSTKTAAILMALICQDRSVWME